MSRQPMSPAAFWVLTTLSSALLAPLVAFGLLGLLDTLLGRTSLNVWGDAEGLIVGFYALSLGLFVVGIFAAWLVRRTRPQRGSG